MCYVHYCTILLSVLIESTTKDYEHHIHFQAPYLCTLMLNFVQCVHRSKNAWCKNVSEVWIHLFV